MYLLNIQSSPRRSRSASIAVADAFVEAYRHVYPHVTVDTLNVWEENLPEFDQEASWRSEDQGKNSVEQGKETARKLAANF
jgi:FMN-dependent NADH-azoreductase